MALFVGLAQDDRTEELQPEASRGHAGLRRAVDRRSAKRLIHRADRWRQWRGGVPMYLNYLSELLSAIARWQEGKHVLSKE